MFYLVSSSGEGEIRTLDALSGIPVFETGAFGHSATSPEVVWERQCNSDRELFPVNHGWVSARVCGPNSWHRGERPTSSPSWRSGLGRGDRRARGLAGKVDSASDVDLGTRESGQTLLRSVGGPWIHFGEVAQDSINGNVALIVLISPRVRALRVSCTAAPSSY